MVLFKKQKESWCASSTEGLEWYGMKLESGRRASYFKALGCCKLFIYLFFSSKQWEATERFKAGVWHDQTCVLRSSLGFITESILRGRKWRQEDQLGGDRSSPAEGSWRLVLGWWKWTRREENLPAKYLEGTDNPVLMMWERRKTEMLKLAPKFLAYIVVRFIEKGHTREPLV